MMSGLWNRFVEQELADSPRLVEGVLRTLVDRLAQHRSDVSTSAERQHHAAIVQAVQQAPSTFQTAFCAALAQSVRQEMERGTAPAVEDRSVQRTGHPYAALDGLELMDERQVESEVEIARATHQIDAAAEWELRRLQPLTSGLLGQLHVTVESNPLRPAAYAQALWEASGALQLTASQRVVLLRLSAAVIAPLLRKAWADAATRLAGQGVKASAFRALRTVDGSLAKPAFDVTVPGALDKLKRQLSMAAGGQDAANPAVAAGQPERSANGLRQAATTAPNEAMRVAFAAALARLDALLRQVPPHLGQGRCEAQPQTDGGSPDVEPSAARSSASSRRIDAPVPRLTEHAAALQAAVGSVGERQTIELLSRLFDAVLSDGELQPELRTVMARLQVAALRVALSDSTLTQSHAHPVWQLMDALAAAGARVGSHGDPRLDALLAFAEPVARALAAAAQPTADLFKHQLSKLHQHVSEQFREAVRIAEPAWRCLEDAERAQHLARTLAQRFETGYDGVPATPPIRRLMLEVWPHVVAACTVQDGEEAARTVAMRAVVDDLAWTLQVPDHPQSRQRLLSLLPKLLARLREGMTMVRVSDAVQTAVLDELMRVHAQALRPKRAAVGQIKHDARATDGAEQEDVAFTGARFVNSLIDVASMDTVPAPLLSADTRSTEPLQPVSPVDYSPGRHYRLVHHGRWSAAGLLWRSPAGQFFLFQDHQTGRYYSFTERALRRLAEAKLLQPLVEHSLIQRAANELSQATLLLP